MPETVSTYEQFISGLRQQIFTTLDSLLGEKDSKGFYGKKLAVNFDLRCREVVVSRLVDPDRRAATGYRVSLQGLPDPNRFADTFELDPNNHHKDQFVGTVMTSGDYQRLAGLIAQLK